MHNRSSLSPSTEAHDPIQLITHVISYPAKGNHLPIQLQLRGVGHIYPLYPTKPLNIQQCGDHQKSPAAHQSLQFPQHHRLLALWWSKSNKHPQEWLWSLMSASESCYDHCAITQPRLSQVLCSSGRKACVVGVSIRKPQAPLDHHQSIILAWRVSSGIIPKAG